MSNLDMIKLNKCFIVLFMLILGGTYSLAQIKVTGTITGSDNQPIPGAKILIVGTNAGTVSNIDGLYEVSVPNERTVLEFRAVGTASQKITVRNQRVINVLLEDDNKLLDEVVVVGYGTMRKSDLTGAVSSYRPDEQEASKFSSIDNLLQGKIAGLSVGATVAAPGAATSVTIRGANSLRGDNQPLYVIDNIPQASTGEFASNGSDGTFTISSNPLSSLNPSDIESIEVLKDASATAIYGSRGANGVILVTTKRGKAGKPAIQASANFTVANASNLLNMMNLRDYAAYQLVKGGGFLKDASGKWNLLMPDPKDKTQLIWNDNFQFYLQGNDVYRFNGENTKLPEPWTMLTPIDWQREIYSQAFSHNYTVSINGGSDKVTYFTSASFKDIGGLVKNTGVKQGDIRLNLNADLSNSVKLALSLNGSIKKNNMMAGGNTTGGATGAISNVALYSSPYVRSQEEMELSTPNLADRATVWTWVDDYDDITYEKTFRASLDLNWNINKLFTYNLRAGGNVGMQERDRWYNITLYTGAMQNGYITQSNFNRTNYTVENLIQYHQNFNDIVDINATGAVTYDDYNSLNTLIVGNDFDIYDFRSNGMHLAKNVEVKQPIQGDYQLFSYLLRTNFSFLEGRYLLTASIRSDATSKFIKGNRRDYFPAVNVAWRLEQEDFLKNHSWINQLKVRLGYGETGSQSIAPYSTISKYGTQFTNTPQGADKPAISADAGGNKLLGLVIDKMANAGLIWERTRSFNAGIDFSFYNDRLGGTIDVYDKTTSDLLIQKELPTSTGYKSLTINQGELNNKGIELALRGGIIRNTDFEWNLGGNISFNNPTILDFGLPEQRWGNENWKAYMGNSLGDHFGEANIFIVGQAPGLFYGYQTEGVIQNNDEYLTRITKSLGTLASGNYKLVDQTGDGIIDINDRVILGNPNPKFTYGFNTDIRWRDITLSAAFNGRYGNQILNANARYFMLPSNSSGMLYASSFEKMWRNDNPWIGEYYGNELSGPNSVVPKVVMDKFVEDGSFLRCSDITLGYVIPKSVIKNIGFSAINVFASVKNAFILTKYSGYDPEVNSFAFDGTRPGIDMSSYPHTRSIIFGLNINL